MAVTREYRVLAAEELAETEAFSCIFCNSAFQRFADPGRVLANCARALAASCFLD